MVSIWFAYIPEPTVCKIGFFGLLAFLLFLFWHFFLFSVYYISSKKCSTLSIALRKEKKRNVLSIGLDMAGVMERRELQERGIKGEKERTKSSTAQFPHYSVFSFFGGILTIYSKVQFLSSLLLIRELL